MPRKTIVVAEDEPLIAENIAYALSTEGWSPLVCRTGAEVRRALAEGVVELVILDLGLPDVSGFTVLGEIRKNQGPPVIVVTARADEVDRVAGLEMGADDYVVKPFSPRELTARVRAVLRRTGGAPEGEREEEGEGEGEGERGSSGTAGAGTGAWEESPAERAKPLEIDEERLRISCHGVPLVLSRTEYRILRALAAHPGRVFSRRRLMEEAWDEPDMSLERTVDAHVKAIRRKIRAVRADLDPIETHRGDGYSLKESW